MKILLFDIETSPNLGYIWGKYEQDVLQYVRQGSMLSFAYKWLDEKFVHARSLPDFPLYKKDKFNDKELIKELWDLLDEADVVIAHNGDAFDIKKVNAFFAKAGLTPPSPYQTVDTLKVARNNFKFNSNKLDDLGDYLGIGRKYETGGFGLWKGCMDGDSESWRKMVKYNKQDVVLLELVYKQLRPWIKNHPRLYQLDCCPNCGSDRLQKRGTFKTISGTRQKYWCINCGKWPTGKVTELPQILK